MSCWSCALDTAGADDDMTWRGGDGALGGSSASVGGSGGNGGNNLLLLEGNHGEGLAGSDGLVIATITLSRETLKG